MKPVTVEAAVQAPSEVFDFLDALANHERLPRPHLVDWKFSGPARGVGAKAEARVERARVAGLDRVRGDRGRARRSGSSSRASRSSGKRETRGTYRLEHRPDGGTRIEFELEWS